MQLIREGITKHYFPTTMRELKRLINDNNLPVGWPCKWGGTISICYRRGDKYVMADTGLKRISDWSDQEWINWIKKECV